MSDKDTIRAAINLLEDLKKSSTAGPWYSYRDTLQGGYGEFDNLIEAGDYAASSEQFKNPIDTVLIVTLHRTIDAQLAILRAWAPFAHFIGARPALDLARAILGETSA